MRWKYYLFGAKYYSTVFAIVCMGCSVLSPHENFKSILHSNVGRSLDEIPPTQFPHEKDIISTKKLPNGNIENRYKYRVSCVYIYEIDPKTRRIVGASFEGKETDCVINP